MPRVLAVVASLALVTRASAADTAQPFDVAPISVGARDAVRPAEPPSGPSTNASGDIAFIATDGTEDLLQLRYNSGVTLRLVAAGDPLMGSTVTRIVVMPSSLDGYRQVLFYAVLADGRAGLFRATPPPAPFAISPTWGYRHQPISFQLTGDGFTPGMQVFFGGVQAGFVTVISPRELTGIIGAKAPAGKVDVTVTRPGSDEHAKPVAFEFRDPPVSGCQCFWPQHRPGPAAAALPAPQLSVVCAAVAMHRRARRRRKS